MMVRHAYTYKKESLRVVASAVLLALLASGTALSQQQGDQGTEGAEAHGAGAPAAPVPVDGDFMKMLRELFPLSEDEIGVLNERHHNFSKARTRPPASMPKPISDYRNISLLPGSPPSLVRLFPGIATAVAFQDRHGAPWPLESFTNASNVDVSILPRENANILNMIGQDYAFGSLTVYLRGLQVPIPIMLTVPGDENAEIDMRLDFRVDGQHEPLTPAGDWSAPPRPYDTGRDELLLNVLVGLKPAPDATRKRLREEPEALLWALQDKYYMRTSYHIVWPVPYAVESSPDGQTFAYLLPASSSYFGLKDKGEVALTVEDNQVTNGD